MCPAYALFDSLLNPLAALSCHLQGNASDLPFVLASLEAFYITIQTLRSDDPARPSELSKSVASSVDTGNPCFRNVKLSGPHHDILATFNISCALYIDALEISGQFDEFSNNHFKAVRLLDTTLWPTDKSVLSAFGIADLSPAIDHFTPLLLKNNVSLDGNMIDWNSFKQYWLDNMQGLEQNHVWLLLLSQYKEKFLNLAHLVNILMEFSISNAKVERGFSAMRCTKTDCRYSLGEDTLDSLLRIHNVSVDGPPLELFDPNSAVARFLSTPRHTEVLSYGSNMKILTQTEYHSITLTHTF